MRKKQETLKQKESRQHDLNNKIVDVRNSMEDLRDSVAKGCSPDRFKQLVEIHSLLEMFLKEIELIE